MYENNIKDFKDCVDQLNIEAFVDSVYDGDSIKLIFPFHGHNYRWTCRLNGIDTPEIRSSNLHEKELGLKVRDIVREKILNKTINILCHSFDKYGRLLIDVYIEENLCLNEWLVENSYANSYNGGTKIAWK